MTPEPNVRNAARLTYKALHTTLSPINDADYRELLALCRADPTFRRHVEDVAAGMELQILDLSEQKGLIVVPASKDILGPAPLGSMDVKAEVPKIDEASQSFSQSDERLVFCERPPLRRRPVWVME